MEILSFGGYVCNKDKENLYAWHDILSDTQFRHLTVRVF